MIGRIKKRLRMTRWHGLLIMGLACSGAFAAEVPPLKVADPFLELHSGPDAAYPVFQVIKRDETVEILERKGDWFLVRSPRSKEGWVPREQLERTLTAEGLAPHFAEVGADDFDSRRWELGAQAGSLDGAWVIAGTAGFALTRKFTAEVALSQAMGNYSSSWLANVSLLGTPFPAWRVSPYFALGGGLVRVEPDATLVQSEDRVDGSAHVGLGLRSHITRRFLLRLQYNSYTVFTSNDDNEDPEEWKAGFSVFF